MNLSLRFPKKPHLFFVTKFLLPLFFSLFLPLPLPLSTSLFDRAFQYVRGPSTAGINETPDAHFFSLCFLLRFVHSNVIFQSLVHWLESTWGKKRKRHVRVCLCVGCGFLAQPLLLYIVGIVSSCRESKRQALGIRINQKKNFVYAAPLAVEATDLHVHCEDAIGEGTFALVLDVK